MAGVAKVLKFLNPKRIFVVGLLLFIAVSVPGCSGLGVAGCTTSTATINADLVPSTVTTQPGAKVRLDLPGTTNGGDARWTTDAPATVTSKGVFTAPSRIGNYVVIAEYVRSDGTTVRAKAGVRVEQVGKSGDDSFSVDETPTAADPASLELILDVSNPSVVSNGGKPPTFTLTEARRVREISTYHWNDGKGTAAGGTISLAGPGGTRELKVTRTGEGQGGVPNAVWIVDLDETLEPGTYTVADSDPSTWAQNSETLGKGMTWVRAEKR